MTRQTQKHTHKTLDDTFCVYIIVFMGSALLTTLRQHQQEAGMSEIRWVSETIRARIASDANMQAALRYLDEADPNYNLGVLTAIGLKSVGIDYIGACHAYEVMLSELDSAKKAAPIDEESIFSEFGVHKDTQHLAMAYEKCEAARKRKDEAWKPLGELREAATYPSLIA